jgi:hypothetical protein
MRARFRVLYIGPLFIGIQTAWPCDFENMHLGTALSAVMYGTSNLSYEEDSGSGDNCATLACKRSASDDPKSFT